MANMARISSKPNVNGKFIWPPRKVNIRPLRQREIERLEDALSESVDRDYLVFWVSQSIANHVKFSMNRPTARECRDGLMGLARQGRRWLRQIDACPGTLMLRQGQVAELKETVSAFCDQVETVVKEVDRSIKPGRPRTSAPLQAFVGNMIGIAKRARVLPSTPSRAMGARTWATSFFEFVTVALSIAKDVIETSALADHEKKAALAKLRFVSDEALVKIIECSRGRIRSYQHSLYGLIEWNNK
jgi:hypothetical protein